MTESHSSGSEFPEHLREFLESLGDTEAGREYREKIDQWKTRERREPAIPLGDLDIDEVFGNGTKEKLREFVGKDPQLSFLAASLFFPESLDRFSGAMGADATDALSKTNGLRNQSDMTKVDTLTQKLETFRLATGSSPHWPFEEVVQISQRLRDMIADDVEAGTDAGMTLAVARAVRHMLLFGLPGCEGEIGKDLTEWARRKASEGLEEIEEMQGPGRQEIAYREVAQYIAQYYILKSEKLEFIQRRLKLVFGEENNEL